MDENCKQRNSEILSLGLKGYIIGKKIGEGSYATVYCAQYIDQNNFKKSVLACKVFDKENAPRDFSKKFFPREIDILKKINHPNIIGIQKILQRKYKVFIFMKYAENGDLLQYIKTHQAIEENQARNWFWQIINGLHYLHGINIAHRDLKCENILLTKDNNIKITDFGFARLCSDSNNKRVLSETFCGSSAYAAPEVISGTPYNPKLADIWSTGIILFIMLSANIPFPDESPKQLYKNQMARRWGFKPGIRNKLSKTVQALIFHILEPDITKRYSLENILNHNWFQSMDLSLAHLNTRLGKHPATPIADNSLSNCGPSNKKHAPI